MRHDDRVMVPAAVVVGSVGVAVRALLVLVPGLVLAPGESALDSVPEVFRESDYAVDDPVDGSVDGFGEGV